MNLCASGHDEVCYEGRFCPFCSYISDQEYGVTKLEDQLETMDEKYSGVLDELAAAVEHGNQLEAELSLLRS